MDGLETDIKAYCEGDNRGLENFYRSEMPKMVFYAYSFVLNKETARDAVGEVFKKLLEIPVTDRNHKYNVSPEYFKNIVYLILRNKCLDTIKVLKNRKKIIQEKLELNHTLELNSSEEVFTLDAMKSLMSQLGQQQKRILLLHLDGFNNNEIASELNISYNTVRNTISASKKKVRMLWTEFFE